MSLNSFFLSVFAKDTKFTQEIQSTRKRYEILSLIYVNLSLLIAISSYAILMRSFFGHVQAFSFVLSYSPLMIFALLATRRDRRDIAEVLTFITIHILNLMCFFVLDEPVVGLLCLTYFPVSSFFYNSARVMRTLNVVVCSIEFILHSKGIQKIFQVTLTEEQSLHVIKFQLATFLIVFLLFVTCLFQKAAEEAIWKMAENNYEKSQNLMKEVFQAVEAKDSFVSLLSHEIRNPLNAMKGSIEYLLDVIKDHRQVKILKNAKLSGEILLNLMTNALDAAKLKADKMEIACSEANFEDVIKKVFMINSERLSSSKISAQAFIERSIPEILWMDSSRLLQILLNLFSNALKFTPDGGKIVIYASWHAEKAAKETLFTPKEEEFWQKEYVSRKENNSLEPIRLPSIEEFDLFQSKKYSANMKQMGTLGAQWIKTLTSKIEEISNEPEIYPWDISFIDSQGDSPPKSQSRKFSFDKTSAKDGYLKVQITDTGCGISPESLPKLFEMFAQTHNRVAPRDHGTGLGLWICKQLCQKMSGDIKVFSKPNQGTTFVFCIPVNNDRLTTSAPLSRHLTSLHEGVNVLVVDDFDFNRELHKLLLERQGVQVITASNGREAVEKYKAHDDGYFDFIMLDVQMPEMDGFTAAKLIREWESEKNMKRADIYFVSGEYFSEQEVMSGFKARGGMIDAVGIRCLRKPIDIEMVTRIVDDYKVCLNNTEVNEKESKQVSSPNKKRD